MKPIIFTALLSLPFGIYLNESTEISNIVESDLPYLIEFYKERHMHPEVSLKEKETAAKLAEELKGLGFVVTENFGGYGIVGILKKWYWPNIALSYGYGCFAHVRKN